MRWTQRVRAVLVLLVGVMSLLACRPEEVEPPPPTPTDERGDWTDPGRYAACTVPNTGGATCGELESFELAGCDKGSLGNLPRDGVYTLVHRADSSTPTISVGSFRISSDGTQDFYAAGPPTLRRVEPELFYLSSTQQTSATVNQRQALVGCRVEGPRLYGCYVNCRNGQISEKGTFLAEQWRRRAGEAEASGLRLVSESFVEQGMPVDIYVTQGHAYVVSVRQLVGGGGGLTVFDVSDKSAPVLKKTLTLPTDNHWNGVWAKGNALYVASESSGVMVFDITHPADPQLLRSYPAVAGTIDVHTVFVEGERLYAMSLEPTPKTLIFDIREPLRPVLLGEYAEPGVTVGGRLGFPHDALAYEGRLYINHWSAGYLIVDVSDPSQPKKLGAYTYPYSTSHANAVGKYGERLIAFEGGENWGGHLRVLDVTDPANPKRIGEYALEPNASIHNMVLKEGRLYIAYYHHGVRVLDVTTPESPKEVAYYNTFRETDPDRGQLFFDGAIGIRVPGDGYVYVIDTSRGLLIFPEP